MTPYLAQIILLGYNFNPRGWQLCAGQLLSIQQNQALFSILGTIYGGNGTQNFGLPDLRGRTPISWGQGPGLPDYVIGEVGGTQQGTLLANNLPLHNHPMSVYNGAGDNASPGSNVLAQGPVISGQTTNVLVYGTSANTTMSPVSINANGSNQPFSTLQPYLVLNYSIATSGIFPSRN